MKYICSKCENAVVIIDGEVIKICKCEAPIIASISSNLIGLGNVNKPTESN